MVIGLVCLLVSIAFGSAFAVTRTITSTGDSFDTFIRNSKGNYWTATAANAQDAVDDLANVSGWVDFGKNNITLTTTLRIGTNCEIRNFHFFLAANTNNVTMIMNYDTTNGNPGIYIHDGYLNGNGLNQLEWYTTDTHAVKWYHNQTGLLHTEHNGIFLIKCSNSTVRDITIYNTLYGALFFQQSKNIITEDVRVFGVGRHLEVCPATGGSVGNCYSSGGIYLYNCSGSVINNCVINRTWSYGICSESTLPSLVNYRVGHNAISDCLVSNTTIGYYFEDQNYITVTNCVAKDGKLKNAAFAIAVGFYAKTLTTDRISFIGCEVNRFNHGFLVGANNLTINGCRIVDVPLDGIESSGNDVIISNNNIEGCNRNIYLSAGSRIIISGNHIYGSADSGYGILLTNTKNVSMSHNDIHQTALYFPIYGVTESGTADYTFIDATNRINVNYRPIKFTGSHSWRMLINVTTGKIGINVTGGVTRWS